MRNDSHNIIIPHAHASTTKLSPRNLAFLSFSLSPARSPHLPHRDPLSRRGRCECSIAWCDLPQNHPLGPHDPPRAQFRTKLSLHHIRPEPSLRGTMLHGAAPGIIIVRRVIRYSPDSHAGALGENRTLKKALNFKRLEFYNATDSRDFWDKLNLSTLDLFYSLVCLK